MTSLLNGGCINAFATEATKTVMPKYNVIALALANKNSGENLQSFRVTISPKAYIVFKLWLAKKRNKNKKNKKKNMKKTKKGIFKVCCFTSGTYSLAFKVYLEYVYYIFSYT